MASIAEARNHKLHRHILYYICDTTSTWTWHDTGMKSIAQFLLSGIKVRMGQDDVGNSISLKITAASKGSAALYSAMRTCKDSKAFHLYKPHGLSPNDCVNYVTSLSSAQSLLCTNSTSESFFEPVCHTVCVSHNVPLCFIIVQMLRNQLSWALSN